MSGNSRQQYLERLIRAGIDIDDARLELDDFITASSGEDELEGFVSRREKGEPAAYILGYKDFFKDRFSVRKGVLIPRSDTEILVETALQFLGCNDMPLGDMADIPVYEDLSGRIRMADLCTGTGCAGLSVFLEMTRKGRDMRLIMSDISETAADCASSNIQNLVPEENKTLVSLLTEDVLTSDGSSYTSEGLLDVVISNPPYINDEDMKTLPFDVASYEPELALRGGPDGLSFYFRLAFISDKILKEGGALIVEHGYDQGPSVREIFEKQGFNSVTTLIDYGGNDRVTFGRKKHGR